MSGCFLPSSAYKFSQNARQVIQMIHTVERWFGVIPCRFMSGQITSSCSKSLQFKSSPLGSVEVLLMDIGSRIGRVPRKHGPSRPNGLKFSSFQSHPLDKFRAISTKRLFLYNILKKNFLGKRSVTAQTGNFMASL